MVVREDGEFELILGNKQLLSVLFIVIVLLGVFFVMGFLAGRSTGSAATTGRKQSEQAPLPVASARPAPATTATEVTPPAAVPEPTASEPPPPAPKAEPVRPEPKAAEKTKPEPKREPAKAEKPKPEPTKPAAPPHGGVVDAPPAGAYLQAAATRRADAESMLAAIGSKTGLRGYVAPVPKSTELFRVLLGPFKGGEEISRARVKLVDIGIKSAINVSYK
jgi:outer membrane biosynthesis protein TonB